MLQTIRDTNPAQKWMGEKFQVSLKLTNGHTVIVRFGLSTTGKPDGRFDTEKVLKHFSHAILADPETNYGEYLNVAATIADVINKQMALTGADILQHVSMAQEILVSLGLEDNDNAYLVAIQLSSLLTNYSPASDQIWADWLNSIIDYIEGDSLGLDGIVWNDS